MTTPLQITCRHFPPSDALSAFIRDEANSLEQIHDRIVRCHVTVERPHNHHEKGRHFLVRIEVVVPGGDLFAGRDPVDDRTHEDPYVAVADAFRSIRRQLAEWTRRRRGETKNHVLPLASVLLALVLLPWPAQAGDSIFPTKAEVKNAELLQPKQVSTRTREYLKTKMKNHGADARQLALEVALLQWDAAKKHANEIAAQPRLEKTAAVPELTDGFFVLQEQLRTRAGELSAAADRKDPKGTAAAYGAMLDTCATCHAVYLPQTKLAAQK
jgi:ribosome-associated translation inhibitor RaiA/cytochrome c556